MIDRYKRYQQHLKLHDFYPSIPGLCACGCGKPLTGKRTRWATDQCAGRVLTDFLIIKGDTDAIRSAVYNRDKGVCRDCGLVCVGHDRWEADHILPVHQGGGGCGLDNFQTLCEYCHKDKTQKEKTTPPPSSPQGLLF